MQKVSGNYERLRKSQNEEYKHRVVIDNVGTFEEGFPLLSVKTNIKLFQDAPEIGKAVAGEVDVSILNSNVEIPVQACVRLYTRAFGRVKKSLTVTITGERLSSQYASYSSEIITFSAASGASVTRETLEFAANGEEYLESEWLPQGVFYIDTRDVTANENGLDVLTIHGFDAMLKTEQEYSSSETVGDNFDTAYVRAIATAIGVDVDERTWELMQTGYIIPFPLGYTMREILGYIAANYAGFFIMTDEGKLRLVSIAGIPAETNLLIDSAGDVLLVGGDSILI